MPEIPDLEVFSRNLKKEYGGKKIARIKIVNNKNIPDSQRKISLALNGETIEDIYRSGKELRFVFSNGRILGMHLMLSGDLIPFEGKNERKSTKVEFHFEDGNKLALADRFKNAFIKLDPEDKEGIDALDRKLNYRYLQNILSERTAAIKNVLTDQHVIRGIGNSYSDEILWQSRISPFSKSNAIPAEKVKELAKNIKKVLKQATTTIYKNHPGVIHGEIKDYLQIHTKKKDKSPTGAEIKTADRGMLKTYYTDEQVLYK